MPKPHRLSNAQKIAILKKVKASIFTSEVVVDTLWMIDSSASSNETVIEAIDGILLSLGEDADVLESENDFYHRAGLSSVKE